MEMNIEKELQILKSDYEVLKKELKGQKILNEQFFRAIRKQSAFVVGKEIKDRMRLDALTVPMVIVICILTDWPILFGVLVSLWALADLGITWWVNRNLEMDNLLNDDVRTVTGKIAGYRKFYIWSLIIGIIPLTVMLVYIYSRLYAQAENPATVQLITLSGIISTVLAVVVTLLRYRKHAKRCNELLEQFKEQ